MTVVENHCCDCAAPGYPCMGSACPNRRVTVFYCDNTLCAAHDTGTERLYVVGDSQLCAECVDAVAERVGVDVEDLIEGEV